MKADDTFSAQRDRARARNHTKQYMDTWKKPQKRPEMKDERKRK